MDAKSPLDRMRRIYRIAGVVWVMGLVGLMTRAQYGKTNDFGLLLGIGACGIAFPVLALLWITQVESHAFRDVLRTGVAGFGGAWIVAFGCRTFGLGHWPQSDASFASTFRAHAAEFAAARDALLQDVRPWDAPSRPAEVAHEKLYQGGYLLPRNVASDALGAAHCYAAPDGSWLCIVMWEGQIHFNPIDEKGLLYVRADAASGPGRMLVASTAVERLGGGWFVYER